MQERPPPLVHRLFFWFSLATLSQVLPEVVTLNTPIPWASVGGWVLGYPVYGLHVLVLAGLLYRWPIAGYRTLLAYGGIFGLYEGYLIKQLWNPNWAVDVVASIGGVRVFHTLALVFFLHPLLAFVLPLLLAERLLLAPGRLSAVLPSRLRSPGGTVGTMAAIAVGLGVVHGSNLPGRSAMVVPLVSIAVLSGLGLIWRYGLHGHRFRMEELLPRGRWLRLFAGLLVLLYVVAGTGIRPDAFPSGVLPHLIVWVLYLFLAGTIVAVTRNASPGTPGGSRPSTGSERAVAAGTLVGVFLLVTWVHAPYTQPGQTIAILAFLGGGIANLLFLAFVLVSAVLERGDHRQPGADV